jgi:PleD family two-component response regulator
MMCAEILDAIHSRCSPVTASIGVATFLIAPADSTVALRMADAAMYEAKAAGKNRSVHHTLG